MKTIIKILIAVAVLNAVARSGKVAMDYFELKDAMQQVLTFGAQTSTTLIRNGILAKAEELRLPVLAENVTVRRQGVRTTADVHYTQPVELFPRFIYPLELDLSVDVVSLYAGPPDEPSR